MTERLEATVDATASDRQPRRRGRSIVAMARGDSPARNRDTSASPAG